MIRSATWLALAALIVGAAFHAFTPPASACTCLLLTPEEELEQADAVFLGELVSIKRIGQFPRNSDEPYTTFVDVLEFKTSEIWKGHPYETIYAHAWPSDWDVSTFGSCDDGYMFWGGEGERFVVFVSDDRVGISLCRSSENESQALNHFAVYGVGRPPEPGSVSPMPSPPPDISAPSTENSPPSAGRCGLPLRFVSNYGDAAALIMIVGLPGFARLISRRRTRKSSRDA